MTSLYMYSLGIHGADVFAGSAGIVYRSTDDGLTWNISNTGMGFVTAYSFASAGSDLFAGTYQLGVYRSTDGGANWSSYGLSGSVINALAVNGANLFAGVEGGIQRRRTAAGESLVRLEGSENILPDRFSLEQNYPNPFNPSTKIVYRVDSQQSTVLKVYDALGQEVATLVNEVQGPGTYTVNWNATGFTSGVYFYRLTAGSYVETRKLVVAK
jgi:hypothetical protein